MRRKFSILVSLLSGVLLGSLFGDLAKNVSLFSWLDIGPTIGVSNFNLNLDFLNFSFGLTVKCTIATVIGLVLAIIICMKIFK